MKTFPTLYQLNTGGAIKVWSIAVDGAVIVTSYGQLGGAIQTTRDEVKAGKNLGKKNATTPETQALAEAQSKHDAKRGEGYVADLDKARRGEVDADAVAGGIDPMLAHPFGEKADKVEYPVSLQPKLDGFRCTADVIVSRSGDEFGILVSLWSRERKAVPFRRIQAEIVELFRRNHLVPGAYVLDGELYAHKYHRNFPKLTSQIRNQADDVELHLYDAVLPICFEERIAFVRKVAAGGEAIRVVPTSEAASEAEVHAFVDRCVAEGFEGGIVRQRARGYEHKRSTQLLKCKKWQDREFIVVGHKEGRGKLAGCPIWVCDAGNGQTFDCKQDGKNEALRAMWPIRDSFVGRQLTVKFFEMTPAGIPRFPVGLRFREVL